MDRRKLLQAGTFGGVVAGSGLLSNCGPSLLTGQQTIDTHANLSSRIPGQRRAFESLPSDKRDSRKVCVIGGGIAGLSAALELASRGYSVTVKESEEYLGGRLHTRKERRAGETFMVEHGLHMWFYQYYNFQNILERLGVWEKNFRDFKEVYFQFKPPLKPEILRSEGPYPLNMVGILKDSPNLNLLNAAGTLGAMVDVVFFDHSTVYQKFDQITFEEWMERARVDNTFREVVMRPASSVTLNDPNKLSAAEMINFQHIYFIGHPRAFHRKVTTQDHETAVIGPWAAKLRDLGVRIDTSSPVQGLVFSGNKATGVVGASGAVEPFAEVVLALDVPGLKRVLSGSRADDTSGAERMVALRERVKQMRIAPQYSVLRVWFDKQTSSKRSFIESVVESSQYRPINLLAIMSMLEDECRNWAERTGGSIVEFHLYNTPEFSGLDAETIWRKIQPVAFELLPELAEQGARALDFSLGQFENFTSLEVGQASIRPTSRYARDIGLGNVSLAGDCIATSYPSALMERAVSTGREAANLICAEDDVSESDLVVASSRGPGILPRF
jgi:isorenieratene synthase